MSREFDPENPSNPYTSETPRNPYAATEHGGAGASGGLFDDLIHHIKEREFGFEDILRVSLRLYRRYLKELGGAALVYAVVLGVLNYFTVQYMMDWMVFQTLQDPESPPETAELLEMLQPMLPNLFAVSLAIVIGQAVLVLYTVIRAGERCRKLDRAAGPADSLQAALGRLPLYLLLVLISYFAIFAGLVLCIVPGIALAIHFSMLAAIVGIAGEGFGAFGRSFKILRGRVVRTAMVLIVTYLTLYLTPFVISSGYSAMIPQMIADQIAANPGLSEADAARIVLQDPVYVLLTQIPGAIAGALLSSFTSVATAVMFINFTRDENARAIESESTRPL
ncbi:MAG: hypothetical protein RIF32_03405 [Leptospirales bacterium]|jgi:hypothetical protein